MKLVLFFSCNNAQKKTDDKTIQTSQNTKTKNENSIAEKLQTCWKGKLNSKTNILLYYHREYVPFSIRCE